MLDGFRKIDMRQRCIVAVLCCALACAGVETSLLSTAVAKDGGGNSDGGGRGNDGGRGGEGNTGRGGENEGGRGQGAGSDGGGPGNSSGGRGGEGNSGRGRGNDSGSTQGDESDGAGSSGGARGGAGNVGRGAAEGGRSAGGRTEGLVRGGGALGSGWGTTSPERAREAVSQGWALPLSTVLPTVARYAPGQVLEVDLRQTWNGEWRYEFLVLTKDRRYHEVFVDAQRNQVVQIRRR